MRPDKNKGVSKSNRDPLERRVFSDYFFFEVFLVVVLFLAGFFAAAFFLAAVFLAGAFFFVVANVYHLLSSLCVCMSARL